MSLSHLRYLMRWAQRACLRPAAARAGAAAEPV